jgi:hypothetical protein
MPKGEDTRHHPNRKVGKIKLTEIDGETGKKIGLLKRIKENKKPISTQEEPVVREPINFAVAMGKKPDDGGY